MDHSKNGSIAIPLIEEFLEWVAAGRPTEIAGKNHGETRRMMSEAVMNRILEMRKDGMSGPKIAKKLGICPQAVYDRIWRHEGRK